MILVIVKHFVKNNSFVREINTNHLCQMLVSYWFSIVKESSEIEVANGPKFLAARPGPARSYTFFDWKIGPARPGPPISYTFIKKIP